MGNETLRTASEAGCVFFKTSQVAPKGSRATSGVVMCSPAAGLQVMAQSIIFAGFISYPIFARGGFTVNSVCCYEIRF